MLFIAQMEGPLDGAVETQQGQSAKKTKQKMYIAGKIILSYL
jgi:hypothetical protein